MNSEILINQLNDTFAGLKLDAKCIDVRQHRHFCFYDVKLGLSCRVNKLQSLGNEIALRIKSKTTPITRILREKGIVRLQVVNGIPEPLDFVETYNKPKPQGLVMPFVFGETDEGEILWNDMAANPHMLVAGSTGSGKSVFLHTLMANAVRTPNLRIYLVDPKGVEFAPYTNLCMKRIVWQTAQHYAETIEMLNDLVQEMEERYEMLMELGCSSIDQAPWLFDKILVIIDEVSDIMMIDGRVKRFESLIVKLAQKCRAVGMYMVLATQRPSVDVLTGLIKANFEARLACRVSSRVDSQVILDHPGAEHLVGRGDAIFKNRVCDSVRLQIAYVKPQDTIEYCRKKFQI